MSKNKSNKETSVWTILLKVIIAIATALLGVIGGTEVYAALSPLS